jgi:beta-phosphoglucomutase
MYSIVKALRLNVLILVLIVGFNASACASIKAVIFDCDGVLVDTEYLKFEAWRDSLSKYNISFELKDYLPLVGHSSEKIVFEIAQQNKVAFDEKKLIQEKNAFYKKRQAQGVPAIPEAVNFLKTLLLNKVRYDVKVGLASSAPYAEIINNLKSIGVNPKDFDAIASGDDDLKHISDPGGTNKPKPYIYQVIAKSLDVAPKDCIVFEDTHAGVEAAATAGMRVFATPNRFTEKHDFSKAVRILSFKDIESKKLLDEFSVRQGKSD